MWLCLLVQVCRGEVGVIVVGYAEGPRLVLVLFPQDGGVTNGVIVTIIVVIGVPRPLDEHFVEAGGA